MSANENRSTVTAKAITDNFDDVLALVADMLIRPRFDEQKFNLTKRQWKSGIMHRNDDPDDIGEREFKRSMLGNDHPYARIEEIATIDNISLDDLKAFYRRYYIPSNISIGVVGDFKKADMKAKIEKAFGSWSGSIAEKPPLPGFPVHFPEKIFFVQKDGLKQSTINMGHQGITTDSSDYYVSRLITSLLGSGRDSKVYLEIRSKRGWAYTAYGYIGDGMDHPEPVKFYLQTSSENTVPSINEIKKIIRDFKKEPPTDHDLKRAKNNWENTYPFRFGNPMSTLSSAMVYDYYGYPANFDELLLPSILSVTKEQIFEASQRLLRPDSMVIVIVGDTLSIPDLKTLGKIEFIDVTINTETSKKESAPKNRRIT